MSRPGRGPDVELVGVARSFGPVRALAGIDLTIPAGTSVAVMGGNGAGKTTLLRVIAGLAAPTTGMVRIAGIDRRRAGPGLRALLGYVGHDSLLYGDLTVRENLAFHASLHGLPTEVVTEVAARFEVTQALDRPARLLSRGNRQRAALARALLHDPAIVLLDEPYTGLDLASAERLTAHLAALHRRGHTIVLTAHEAGQAVLAERVVVLAEGHLVADEPAEDIEVVAALVRDAQRGRPPRRLPARVSADDRQEVAR